MIKLENVTRIFGRKKEIGQGIRNVSFTINDGDIVAFVGDNGAGKTTTIKAIFGEVRLTGGTIYIDGKELHKNNRLQKLSFFPDSNNIPLDMTIDEYVRYLCAANGISHEEYKINSIDIYSMLELEPHINKQMKELSAGLKKRAIMATVLIRRPKYILLDEPTANLDVESKIEFIDILKELNNFGVTILITSHIIEELQEIANHLVLIANGKIVYDEAFNNKTEKMIDIYRKYSNPKIINLKPLKDVYERGTTNGKLR
jgi:ABC-2 type transport system ATP-binding protein